MYMLFRYILHGVCSTVKVTRNILNATTLNATPVVLNAQKNNFHTDLENSKFRRFLFARTCSRTKFFLIELSRFEFESELNYF